MSGLVVAGGRSRRLGFDKRMVRLWGSAGPTLLEHTVAVLAPLCDELLVALNDRAAWPHLPARLVPDSYHEVGPLGGLYAGLSAATHQTLLVVAADLPFLNGRLLQALLDWPGDYDALVPRALLPETAHHSLALEPLHAIYRRSCLEPLRSYLEGGGRSINGFLANIHTHIPPVELIEHYDPAGRSFLNLNTADDLALAQQLIARLAT